MTHSTSLLITAGLVSTGLIAYCVYRSIKHLSRNKDVFDEKEIQHVNQLSLKAVADWVDTKVDSTLVDNNKLRVNILSNKATLESFRGNLKLPQRDLKRCILVLLLNDSTKTVLKRKLIIPNTIADDLLSVKNGKIYEFDIE